MYPSDMTSFLCDAWIPGIFIVAPCEGCVRIGAGGGVGLAHDHLQLAASSISPNENPTHVHAATLIIGLASRTITRSRKSGGVWCRLLVFLQIGRILHLYEEKL